MPIKITRENLWKYTFYENDLSLKRQIRNVKRFRSPIRHCCSVNKENTGLDYLIKRKPNAFHKIEFYCKTVFPLKDFSVTTKTYSIIQNVTIGQFIELCKQFKIKILRLLNTIVYYYSS